MAGINRLGKAPPKPGTLRPPDPNKYRTVDMFSEDIEGDADYLKMVQDIEDLQQQQGWLFGRGAFDKGDLLYLRDEAQKQRHAELELRDQELSQFAALRAKMDRQEKKRKDTGDVTSSLASGRSTRRSQTKILSSMIKVKPKIQPKGKKRRKEDSTEAPPSDKAKKTSLVGKSTSTGSPSCVDDVTARVSDG